MRESTGDIRDNNNESPGTSAEPVEPPHEDTPRTGDEPVASLPPYDKIDDASDDSFPASDAPAWTGMSVG